VDRRFEAVPTSSVEVVKAECPLAESAVATFWMAKADATERDEDRVIVVMSLIPGYDEYGTAVASLLVKIPFVGQLERMT
jgi:hypothetical protein